VEFLPLNSFSLLFLRLDDSIFFILCQLHYFMWKHLQNGWKIPTWYLPWALFQSNTMLNVNVKKLYAPSHLNTKDQDKKSSNHNSKNQVEQETILIITKVPRFHNFVFNITLKWSLLSTVSHRKRCIWSFRLKGFLVGSINYSEKCREK